jgi:hypothetical protein
MPLGLSPAGFFEDKKADAKARGEVPKSQKDMTKVLCSWCTVIAGPPLELPGHHSPPPPAGVTGRQRLPAFPPACLNC